MMFNVDRKIPTLGSSVPRWNGGPSGWDFPASNDVFYLSGMQDKSLLKSYQLSSNSSQYVMDLRIYCFENRRQNEPFAQIGLTQLTENVSLQKRFVDNVVERLL